MSTDSAARLRPRALLPCSRRSLPRVLDAGCGTGYLSRKLHARGAKVIGIDFSEEMIRIARSKLAAIDFRVDSCSELKTVQDESVDLIVANYVLMDTPDLMGTIPALGPADGGVSLTAAVPPGPDLTVKVTKGGWSMMIASERMASSLLLL